MDIKVLGTGDGKVVHAGGVPNREKIEPRLPA